MLTNEPLLPAGFGDLEPFVQDWALPENMQRYVKRVRSSMRELEAFYNAVEPRAEAALTLLNSIPIAEISGPEARLMHLLMSLVDVSLAIEVYKAPALPLSPTPERYSVRMERMTFG